MTPDRYRKILSEFDILIAHALSISNRLTGRRIDGRHMPYVDTLFTKLICHGISLRKLSPPANIEHSTEIWDLPSSCTVARALIEAYDALSYIGTVKIDNSEREFRVLVWEYHDAKRRLAMLERVGSIDSQVDSIRATRDDLEARLKKHDFYLDASASVKHRVDRGESYHLTHRELNAASGVDHRYYETVTMFLSQYVHSLPLSLHQLMHMRAGEPDAIRLSSMPFQYVMPFIAKAIESMTFLWPDCEGTRSDDVHLVIEQWLLIAAKGVADSHV